MPIVLSTWESKSCRSLRGLQPFPRRCVRVRAIGGLQIPAAAISAVGSVVSGLLAGNSQKDAASEQAKAYLAAAQLSATGYQKAGEISAKAAEKAAPIVAGGYTKAGQLQAGAADKAIATQRVTGQQAVNEQRSQLADLKAGMAPYTTTGAGATYSLADLYGLPTPSNPKGGQPLSDSSLESFRNSPDYQFALKEGVRATDMGAAKGGALLSGGAQRGLEEFGQGLASQQYGNYFNRLLQLSQMGEGASEYVGNAELSTGRGIADTKMQTGRGVATTQLAKGDALARAGIGSSGATAAGITSAAGARAVGLTGATSAYTNALEQAANINAAGSAGSFNNISGGVSDAFSNLALAKYIQGNSAGATK